MIKKYRDKMPETAENVFIAENATVIGDVKIGKGSSVWFGAVVRGDADSIEIGEGSNVQDNATIHCDEGVKTMIGDHVTIGHNAIVHGAKLSDNVMVGMGATVMNDAHIGKNSIIGAGALVPERMEVPENSIVMGVPAKVVKQTSEKHAEYIKVNAEHYVTMAGEYLNDK